MAGGQRKVLATVTPLGPAGTVLGCAGGWKCPGPSPHSCSGWEDASIPRKGCSAPLRLGLLDGSAIRRKRRMRYNRDHIPLHKPGMVY